MQNPQRLIFQQLPEGGEGIRQENLRSELPEPGTDAKNIASQTSEKLRRFFEDTNFPDFRTGTPASLTKNAK